MGAQDTHGRSTESLRKEAKRWLKAFNNNDAGARARLERALGRISAQPGLRDIQHALAIEMGFAGWDALKAAASERPLRESVAGTAALARYDDMANALLDAYRAGTPEAMARHYAFTWHRRGWQSMRTYVQLDLGKRPTVEGSDVDITLDDARKLVALEYGFSSWNEVESFAGGLTDAAGVIAPKPVAVTIRQGDARRVVVNTRDWQAVFAALSGQQKAGVDARGQMTDAVLDQLSRVASIQELRLGNSNALTDDGIKHLARMEQLRHLDLSMTAISDEGLKALGNLHALESINLAWTRITDAGASHLHRCAQLRNVVLTGTATGDGALRTLAGKRDLAVLHAGNHVTDAGLRLLHEYPVFRAWRGGDAGFALLSPDATPNQLMLSTGIGDSGMTAIAGLEGLFALNLDASNISARGLAPLAALPHLAWLSINATDDTMPAIAALPHLRHLGCQDTPATDAGFIALSASTSIESIWGRRCHDLRTAGFIALSHMPSLRSLAVSCLNVDDSGIATLPSFPALRELMPMDIPDDGYRHIGRCSELDALTLMYCRDTSDAATEHIVALPKLRKYFASYTKITDRTPELLSTINSLAHVEILGCPEVSDAGIAQLARLPRLRDVRVSGQSISPAIADAFPPGVRVQWER